MLHLALLGSGLIGMLVLVLYFWLSLIDIKFSCYARVLNTIVLTFREYLIDLIGKPGCLCEPDSLLNGPSSISISSPLRFPRLKPIESTIDFRSLAKQYFLDSQSLNIVFDEASSGDFL